MVHPPFQEYPQAESTISQSEALLQLYNEKVNVVKVPLDIQKARNARKAQGSNLEYGLDSHLTSMNSLVSFLTNYFR